MTLVIGMSPSYFMFCWLKFRLSILLPRHKGLKIFGNLQIENRQKVETFADKDDIKRLLYSNISRKMSSLNISCTISLTQNIVDNYGS